MASAKKKVAKAAMPAPLNDFDLASITKANPYIQRLVQDAELRDNVRTAIDSSRSAFDRLTKSKAPQKAIFDDKRLQNDVRDAAEAVRDAVVALQDAPKHPRPRKKKSGFGFGKLMLVLIVGAVAALAGSESLRSKVLDTLFGSEEEFQYTPPAGTPTPPPASPVSAA